MDNELLNKEELFNKIIRNLLIIQEMTKETEETDEGIMELQKNLDPVALQVSISIELYKKVFGEDINMLNVRHFLEQSVETDDDLPLPDFVV